jgi:hypothetical protein
MAGRTKNIIQTSEKRSLDTQPAATYTRQVAAGFPFANKILGVGEMDLDNWRTEINELDK